MISIDHLETGRSNQQLVRSRSNHYTDLKRYPQIQPIRRQSKRKRALDSTSQNPKQKHEADIQTRSSDPSYIAETNKRTQSTARFSHVNQHEARKQIDESEIETEDAPPDASATKTKNPSAARALAKRMEKTRKVGVEMSANISMLQNIGSMEKMKSRCTQHERKLNLLRYVCTDAKLD